MTLTLTHFIEVRIKKLILENFDLIDNIIKKIRGKSTKNDDHLWDPAHICPVCLEEYDERMKQRITLECNHYCCISCVLLLKKHNILKCPLCRKKVTRKVFTESQSKYDYCKTLPPVVVEPKSISTHPLAKLVTHPKLKDFIENVKIFFCLDF